MAEERQEGPFEQIGQTVGGVVGKMAGRANDMAMNAAATLLGAAVQQLGEWWSSADADRAATSFDATSDQACRQHFEAKASAGTKTPDYESARPVYHFGFVARHNPEYQSKPFDQVESEIERAWAAVGRERFGDWPHVRDQVGFGFTHRTPGAPNPT